MIHCEQLKNKNKDVENLLELCSHQCVEMERCESEELDVEIRNLIERTNTSQLCENPGPIAQDCANNQGTSRSLKTCSESDAPVLSGCAWADVSEMEASSDQLESKHVLLTKKKTITADSVEQQILSLERQRRELLEVNKQWDHQFRSMKQRYEKKLVELKVKLDMSQRRVIELEEETCQNHPENESWQFLGRDGPLQEMKEIKILTGALHEMKEENKLLKEKNASMIKNNEHYECEISRLNKTLLDMLKKQHSSALKTPSAKLDKNNLEDMRTQLEVLRQQPQQIMQLGGEVRQQSESEKEMKKYLGEKHIATTGVQEIEISASGSYACEGQQHLCIFQAHTMEPSLQVQIYEEDFRKERSDRERLNEEKEALQKMNKGLQSQLNKLNSQIKACLKEKEQLERQLQQQTKALPVKTEQPRFPPPVFLSPCVNYGNCGLLLHYQDPRVPPKSRGTREQQQHTPDYQQYVPNQFPPDVQHKANGTSSEKGAHP